MRIALIIFNCLFYLCGYSQQYPSVQIESNKHSEEDNKIFTSGRCFVYDIKILEYGSPKNLTFTDQDWALNDTTEISDQQVSQVFYLITDVKPSKKTNKKQTEVIIGYEPHAKIFQNTGVVENAKNLWLHPPRSKFFRVLEIAPFPYVSHSSEMKNWKDEISISQKWQDDRWATWEGNLKLDISYEQMSRQVVTTNFGKTTCLVTKAYSSSLIGTSSLTSYFNDNIGLVKMDYTILDRYQIMLELSEIIELGNKNSLGDYLIRKEDNSR